MIAYCRPKIIHLNQEKAEIKIPLRRKTKNHFHTMYFGALCVGADFTAGLLVMEVLRKKKSSARLIFKDFNADFLKRADSDVIFVCDDKNIVESSVLKNLKSTKRVNFKLKVKAFSDKSLDPVADFILTTSIK